MILGSKNITSRGIWTGSWALLLTGGAFLFFVLKYPGHFYFAEQMQLFRLTPEHILHYWSKPAMLACLAGEFLIQFYFLTGAGPFIVAVLLLSGWFLIRAVLKRFGNRRSGVILPSLPVAILFVLHLDLSYSLSATLGFLLAVLFFWLFSFIGNSLVRRVLFLFALPLIYWLTGGAVFVFAGLAVLFEHLVAKGKLSFRLIWSGLLAVVLLSSLELLRLPFRLTYAELFLFPVQFRIPQAIIWILLQVTLGVVVVVHFFRSEPVARGWLFAETLLLVWVIGAGISFVGNFRLEKNLAVDSQVYFENYFEAARLARKYNVGNSVGAYYYNLTNSYLGQMPEMFFKGRQTGLKGLFLPVDNRQNYVTITFSNEVYYHLGDVNAAQHSALLGMIFSPHQQSSRLIRRLVQINIINGEYAVAAKYLRILETTWFHRDWAKQMSQYLYNDSLCAQTFWIKGKRDQQPVTAVLKTTNDQEKTLKLLLEKKPDHEAALHYLLCFYLMNKNIANFSETFFQNRVVFKGNLPEIYQQALLIGYAQNPSRYDWRKIALSPDIAARFKKYTEQFEKQQGQGEHLRKEFENTYWFFFHYADFKDE